MRVSHHLRLKQFLCKLSVKFLLRSCYEHTVIAFSCLVVAFRVCFKLQLDLTFQQLIEQNYLLITIAFI